MATAAQIEANRSNAQQSTGPRTPQGKARCAHNALKHGLRSQEAVLDTERREEFDEFAGALRAELRPASEWEGVLAERVIFQAWRLRRAARLETSVLDHAMAPADKRDADWRKRVWDSARERAKERGEDAAAVPEPRPRAWPGERDPYFLGEALVETLGSHSPLDVLRRYERTSERAMYEAMRQLQAARKARAEAPQEAAGEAPEENCQTDPIPAGAMECGEAALDGPAGCRGVTRPRGNPRSSAGLGGDVGCAEDGPTHGTQPASTPDASQGNCQTDPISQTQPATQANPPTAAQAQPVPAADAEAASTPEESCQTDPIAQRERRIAAFRARQRAMRDEERRLGVFASEGTGMQAVI
jgi:hypothetical protein